jgi:hypothetical protein
MATSSFSGYDPRHQVVEETGFDLDVDDDSTPRDQMTRGKKRYSFTPYEFLAEEEQDEEVEIDDDDEEDQHTMEELPDEQGDCEDCDPPSSPESTLAGGDDEEDHEPKKIHQNMEQPDVVQHLFSQMFLWEKGGALHSGLFHYENCVTTSYLDPFPDGTFLPEITVDLLASKLSMLDRKGEWHHHDLVIGSVPSLNMINVCEE